MALKAQKELEQKIHNEFYKNVKILTLLYPPNKEFKEVFQSDMFLKNNKAGFHQVIFYLLNILDHDKITQTVWPLYNVRLETQFRAQVLKYIHELNSQYEDANIPQLAASHLISPGGFKFIKFIFKLSQFVLFEHVKRKASPGILLPVKPSKCESVTVENLRKLEIITEKINSETNQICGDFEKQFDEAKLEAKKIIHEQHETTKLFKENQVQVKLLQKKLDEEYPDLHQNQDRNLLAVEQKLQALKQIKGKFEECDAINSFLGNAEKQLENSKELKIPLEISHLVHYEGENLDLSSLLQGCTALMERKRLEVKPMKDEDVLQQIKRFSTLNEKFASINEDLAQNHSELMKLYEQLQAKSLEKVTVQNRRPLHELHFDKGQRREYDSDSTNSTVLAEPLPLSPIASASSSDIFL